MSEIIDVNTLFGPLPAASSDLSAGDLLSLMQSNGVGRSCMMSTMGLLLDAGVGNAVTKAACADHPEFLPVATLNPMQYFGDPRVASGLAGEGFVMARFFPDEQQWSVRSLAFRELISTLGANQFPIMVSAEKPEAFPDLVEALGSYPGAVIVAGAPIEVLQDALLALKKFPNWYLETSRLLGIGAIAEIAKTAGADRILLGTTAPFRSMSGAIQTVRYSGIGESDTALVLGGNAKRILRLQ